MGREEALTGIERAVERLRMPDDRPSPGASPGPPARSNVRPGLTDAQGCEDAPRSTQEAVGLYL